MDVMTLFAPPKGIKTRKTNFMDLSRELRDNIYEFALIETDKWDRRHKYNCSHCPRFRNEIETPLFLTGNWQGCRCRARTSLNLLLVNRQVNAEAAPIFWKNNTFCFTSMLQLTRDIGRTLRPENREMIRNISFIDHTDTLVNKYECQRFWDTLMQCTGLRELEFHFVTSIGLLTREDRKNFYRLKKKLPSLEKVRWVINGPLIFLSMDSGPVLEGISTEYKPTWHHDPAWWEVKQEVDLAALKGENDVLRSHKRLTKSFAQLVEEAMSARSFGKVPISARLAPGQRKLFKCLSDDLSDRNQEQELKLKDGQVATVRYYGLPLSHETLVRNARLRGQSFPGLWD